MWKIHDNETGRTTIVDADEIAAAIEPWFPEAPDEITEAIEQLETKVTSGDYFGEEAQYLGLELERAYTEEKLKEIGTQLYNKWLTHTEAASPRLRDIIHTEVRGNAADGFDSTNTFLATNKRGFVAKDHWLGEDNQSFVFIEYSDDHGLAITYSTTDMEDTSSWTPKELGARTYTGFTRHNPSDRNPQPSPPNNTIAI